MDLSWIGRGAATAGRGFGRLLEMKNEDTATKKAGMFAFLIITAMLALLSVSGAIAQSEGDGWNWIIRVVFALLIAGAELLAAVIFVRAILAGDKVKMFVCLAIWGGLAWTCVQNAKEGAHAIFASRYEKTATELSGEAEVIGTDAKIVTDAKASTPAELALVRTQIADLEVFSRKMSAMTPEGIMEAQSEMIPRCQYTGRVDGIRSVLTEAAMRRCGEKIAAEVATLKQRESNLLAGQGAVVAPQTDGAPPVDPRLQEVALKAKADKAWWDALKLEVMLWVLEAARSLGLWAAFTSVTASNVKRGRDRDEELAEAEHQAKLAAIRASMVQAPLPVEAPAPTPPAADPPQEPISESPIELELTEPLPPPPEPELTDAQRRARAGGLAAQQARAAEKAEKLIVVGDWEARDADEQAARMAAQ